MSSRRETLAYERPWPQRLRGHLALARISNSPTVVSNVLAGAALAGALRPDGRVVMLAVAMVLFYAAGMFLNDLWDYEVDLRERPERPLPLGLVSRSEATIAVLVLFGAGLLILVALGPAPFVAGLVLVALIALYDRWHKANPLSPVLMASTRLMVYVTSFLAFSTAISGGLLAAGVGLALYLIGLTQIAKSESGGSITRYWPITLLLFPTAVYVAQAPPLWSLPLLPLFVGWVAYSASYAYRRRGRSIGGAVARLIAGISLYDALVLATAASAFGVVLAMLALGSTLYLQRHIRGT